LRFHLRSDYSFGQVDSGFFSALGSLIKEGALDSLEVLKLHMLKCDDDGFGIILRALRGGRCPKLEVLYVLIPHIYQDDEAENGWWHDEEQTQRNMHTLADTLESRRMLGTCRGLKELDGEDYSSLGCYDTKSWGSYGSIGVRVQLLRVLLPSLERLSGSMLIREWEPEFVEVIHDIGAPLLTDFPWLHITNPKDFCVLLDRMISLTKLSIPWHEGFIDASISLMQRCGTALLPVLKQLGIGHSASKIEGDDLN
jgi:hypothetical protein